MLYALAKHPECQRKVQSELDDIFAEKGNETVEWEDLAKFKYLTLCMKESMRLYPPVSDISRCLDEDLEVDGRILKAGVQADIHIYALHQHPDYWETPEEYIPERFLPENSKNRHPYCYVPFSAGPRNCIGQNFALNEEKVILARILYNFEVELDPDHEVNFGLELTLKPSNDIKVVLKKRR
ncbi:cytochrome P450 4V2-like [Amphiura filiformis]|uniref:cytochrome P450 4V2-like n=1 Tax=Amphiura filiformis TaxID=82378 RepID=UPI003B219D5C